MKGKAQPGSNGGPPGDRLIIVSITPHRFFRRIDNDIFIDVPLSITEATLGTKVEVPSLAGIATVTIPAGTPSGAKLRLRGKGVADRGDLYVVVQIVPPKSLTDEQRECVRRLRDLDDFNPREAIEWRSNE